jgi:hypothetical protein
MREIWHDGESLFATAELRKKALDERFQVLKNAARPDFSLELSEDRKTITWRVAATGKVYAVDPIKTLFPPFMIVPRVPERTPRSEK